MSARRRWPNNAPGAPDRARRLVGEHNEEIYRGVAGLSAEQIKELSGKGII